MSDVTQTPEKPEAAKPEAAKPEAPKEPPFNTDILEACTSRFTRKAYNLYLTYRADKDKIENTPVRFSLEARTADAAEEIHKQLLEAGVVEISRQERTVSMTTTFRVLEKVIRHPQTCMVNAVAV